jgi:hypothetical protein
MAVISNMDMEILIEPEEDYMQSNSGVVHNGTISINNSGNMEQDPVLTIKINNALTSLVITNVTTGISATIPSSTISASTSLLVYNDAIYKNNSGSVGSELTTTFTGVFNIAENASNSIRFNLTPSTATSITVNTTWLKPNGNAISQHFVEGFSINENISLKPKSVNILNKYNSGYLDQLVDYDFSIDKLHQDKQLIDIDKTKTYRITYKTESHIGAILPITHYLSGCKFSSYSISQGSTQQTDACKEGVRGKGCKLFEG